LSFLEVPINNNKLYEIKNGIFFETDFDLDSLLNIIKDKEANW
jgi:hypothetical protein